MKVLRGNDVARVPVVHRDRANGKVSRQAADHHKVSRRGADHHHKVSRRGAVHHKVSRQAAVHPVRASLTRSRPRLDSLAWASRAAPMALVVAVRGGRRHRSACSRARRGAGRKAAKIPVAGAHSAAAHTRTRWQFVC